jgi:hypothetical protein
MVLQAAAEEFVNLWLIEMDYYRQYIKLCDLKVYITRPEVIAAANNIVVGLMQLCKVDEHAEMQDTLLQTGRFLRAYLLCRSTDLQASVRSLSATIVYDKYFYADRRLKEASEPLIDTCHKAIIALSTGASFEAEDVRRVMVEYFDAYSEQKRAVQNIRLYIRHQEQCDKDKELHGSPST